MAKIICFRRHQIVMSSWNYLSEKRSASRRSWITMQFLEPRADDGP